jgi:hypothetical protein
VVNSGANAVEIDQTDKEAQKRSREVNEQLNIEEGEGPTAPIDIDGDEIHSSSEESHAETDDEILVLTHDEEEPNDNDEDQGSTSTSHPEMEEGQIGENEDEDMEADTGIEIENVAEDPQLPEVASSEIQDLFESVRGTPRPECLLCKNKLKTRKKLLLIILLHRNFLLSIILMRF